MTAVSEARSVRDRSRREARRLGYGRVATEGVPAFAPGGVRPVGEILERALVLHAVLSAAHGLATVTVRRWLTDAGLDAVLTAGESGYLDELAEGVHLDDTARMLEVESLWALAWALSLVPELDFGSACGAGLAGLLPDPASGDGIGAEVGERAALRPEAELHEARDLAAVLAVALGDPDLRLGLSPGEVEPYVVWERHRALEWLHGAPWEDAG
jgi:hypothetical protein